MPKRNLCLKFASTVPKPTFLSSVLRLCPNCASTVHQLCLNSFCLNCTPSNLMFQQCLARLPSCHKSILKSSVINYVTVNSSTFRISAEKAGIWYLFSVYLVMTHNFHHGETDCRIYGQFSCWNFGLKIPIKNPKSVTFENRGSN